MKNAHEFPHIYERLGINLNDLGCLMLNTESPVRVLGEAVPYVSPDPKKFWMKGLLDHWHVTVRYGFLPEVRASDVKDVLASLDVPEELTISGVEVFPSPFSDEPYECLVARVEDPRLVAMNKALSVLPNLNTYPEFKAHITIGYFDKAPEVELKSAVVVKDFDYGQVLTRNN